MNHRDFPASFPKTYIRNIYTVRTLDDEKIVTFRLRRDDYDRLRRVSSLQGEKNIAPILRRLVKQELKRAGLLTEEEEKALG